MGALRKLKFGPFLFFNHRVQFKGALIFINELRHEPGLPLLPGLAGNQQSLSLNTLLVIAISDDEVLEDLILDPIFNSLWYVPPTRCVDADSFSCDWPTKPRELLSCVIRLERSSAFEIDACHVILAIWPT